MNVHNFISGKTDRQIGQTHSWTETERFGFFYFSFYFDFNFYCILFGATSCDATPHKLYIIWLDFATICCCCFRWMAKVFLREEPLGHSTSSLAVLLTDVETNATLMNSLWSALADRQIYSYSYIWQADRETDRQSCWRFLVVMLPSSLLAVFMTSSLNSHRWKCIEAMELRISVELPFHVSVELTIFSLPFPAGANEPAINRKLSYMWLCRRLSIEFIKVCQSRRVGRKKWNFSNFISCPVSSHHHCLDNAASFMLTYLYNIWLTLPKKKKGGDWAGEDILLSGPPHGPIW